MDSGVRAAIRLLPRHRKDVEELAMASEAFRGICRDLAVAETVLGRLEKSAVPGTAARRLEYRSLVDGLEAELRQAVHEKQHARHRQSWFSPER